MQYVSVRAVASRLKSQFKVDMTIFDCVQACADLLKKTGALTTIREGYAATISNFCINLPASVYKLRAVVRLDNQLVSSIKMSVQDIYFPPQDLFTVPADDEEPKPIKKLEDNVLPQLKGPYIPYVWKCPILKFNETDIPVVIEVTSVPTDEEGFPMIPEPMFFACLYYALYVHSQPLFLTGQIAPVQMQLIEKWKNDNVGQGNSSMMMEALSNNEMNEVFDIMTSMGRKSYGYDI
jgi:hypothetical protein